MTQASKTRASGGFLWYFHGESMNQWDVLPKIDDVAASGHSDMNATRDIKDIMRDTDGK